MKLLSRLGKKQVKFRIDCQVQYLELECGVNDNPVSVVWSRGGTRLAKTKAKQGKDNVVLWDTTLSLICTLFQDDKTQSFLSKLCKFHVLEHVSPTKTKTLGRATYDLSSIANNHQDRAQGIEASVTLKDAYFATLKVVFRCEPIPPDHQASSTDLDRSDAESLDSLGSLQLGSEIDTAHGSGPLRSDPIFTPRRASRSANSSSSTRSSAKKHRTPQLPRSLSDSDRDNDDDDTNHHSHHEELRPEDLDALLHESEFAAPQRHPIGYLKRTKNGCGGGDKDVDLMRTQFERRIEVLQAKLRKANETKFRLSDAYSRLEVELVGAKIDLATTTDRLLDLEEDNNSLREIVASYSSQINEQQQATSVGDRLKRFFSPS